MLPDANSGFDELNLSFDYPFANIIAALGFALVLFLELILSPGHEAIIETMKQSQKHKLRNPKKSNQYSLSRPPTISNIKHNSVKLQNGTPVFRSDSPGPLLLRQPYSPTAQSLGKSVQNVTIQSPIQGINDDQMSSPLKSTVTANEFSLYDSVKSEDIPKVKVRYYSRLFESGFNAAVMLAKKMGNKDVPKLMFQESSETLSDPEHVIQKASISPQNPSVISAIIFLIVLSIHSIITGMAVGGNDSSKQSQWVLLFALIVHKGCASMALGISIKKATFSNKFSLWLIVGFSCTTPIGVAIGLGLSNILTGNVHIVITSSLQAFGSGTFIYLSNFENIVQEFVESQTDLILKWIALLFGIIIMAILAIFT